MAQEKVSADRNNTSELTPGLPVLEPTLGPKMVDIRSYYAETGMYTYDPGLTATGICRSSITYVDGQKGELLYRGYPIEELVERSDFLEVAWLLLNGELPDAEQKRDFEWSITHHTMLHEQLRSIYSGFRRDAHPMAIMAGVVGALSAFYHDNLDIFSQHDRMVVAHRLIAKVPTIAAMAYKYTLGQPFVYPRNDLSPAENLLNMLFSVPCEAYTPNKAAVDAVEAFLILQADHEQNASTSVVRAVGSTRANPYVSIAAGIAALWGPLHGGANEDVLVILEEIGSVENIPQILKRAKDKSDPFRLPGFGHRIYKSYDPRARILKSHCDKLLESLNMENDPLLKVAVALEKEALQDEYFVSRNLYPNVDFYSGIILRAIGLPVEMFTPMFVIARTVGWIAHWNEMIADEEAKIVRPRQLYTGHPRRQFVEMDGRERFEPLVG